jgi:hypothetical protein
LAHKNFLDNIQTKQKIKINLKMITKRNNGTVSKLVKENIKLILINT